MLGITPTDIAQRYAMIRNIIYTCADFHSAVTVSKQIICNDRNDDNIRMVFSTIGAKGERRNTHANRDVIGDKTFVVYRIENTRSQYFRIYGIP